MERLEAAGFPVVRLQVQYRMHPDISSIIIQRMYNKMMINGENTVTGRPADEQFRRFLAEMWQQTLTKKPTAQKFNPRQNAIMISPTKIPNGPPFGSEKLSGSSSRHNLQTASMVYRLCIWLLGPGGFKSSDIMVTSFYKDQVKLLTDVLADLGVACYTVDGSQGKEAPIHIIDCVILGQAAGESMGFLAADMRRWNVGLSRAQSGRILICSERFMTHVKSINAWASTIAEAKAKPAILDDALFHSPMSEDQKTHFFDVFGKFKASAGKGKRTEAPVAGPAPASVSVAAYAPAPPPPAPVLGCAPPLLPPRLTREQLAQVFQELLQQAGPEQMKELSRWYWQ
jgi:hypothetical protein